MPDVAPDTLTVTEHLYDEIRTTGAHVLLKVSERSLGARSSQRVAAIRARLAGRGFAEDDVMLEALDHTPWAWIAIPFVFLAPLVTFLRAGTILPAIVTAGAFVLLYLLLRAAKLGTVTATLKVRSTSAARVGAAVDEALSSGAEIASIGWLYDAPETSQADLAARCAERAHARAARLAASLGVRLLGVHALQEEHLLPQPTYAGPVFASAAFAAPAARRRSASLSESLGELPAATQRTGLKLTIAYRVGGP